MPLLPLWSARPVHSLSACARVHFTFSVPRVLPNSQVRESYMVVFYTKTCADIRTNVQCHTVKLPRFHFGNR